MSGTSRSPEELVLLWVSGVGMLTLTPFAILNLLAGQRLLAVIVVAVVIFGSIPAWYVWRTRSLRVGGPLFAIIYTIGLGASIYVTGASMAYWMFPASAGGYLFLRRPGSAILLNLALLIAVYPVLIHAFDTVIQLRLLAAFTMTNLIAYLFASRTFSQRAVLTDLVTQDPLTGAGNRRALSERMREVLAFTQRRASPAVLLLFDVDNFKELNDSLGHAHGDKVLSGLAEMVRGRIRMTDGFYRYGGDEFVLLLSDTEKFGALAFAENLRKQILAGSERFGGRVTLSIGLAQLADGDTEETWFKRADQALYQAKSSGRDQVVCA